jgi:hypothetical protein
MEHVDNCSAEGTTMEARKPENHILCGTCAGEFERGLNDRGLQDGLKGRTVVKAAVEDDFDDICCVCGQCSAPEARFLMDVEDLPSNWCKGEHPQLERAHGKCDCGTTTAWLLWDFVDVEDVTDATCGGCDKVITLEWTDDQA